MNLKLIFISLGLLLTELLTAQDQTTELSLKQVIEIARMESPDAQTARHSFRSAYWNYKYYRANYLPSLSLTSDPNLNRAINKITMGRRFGKVCRTKSIEYRFNPESFTELILDRWLFLSQKPPLNAWICSANINTHGRLPHNDRLSPVSFWLQ